MSEPTFTPGPWAIEEDPHIHVRAKNGTQDGWGSTVLARDHCTPADANLIKAAPDLYEALERVTDLLVATVTEFGCWTAEDHPKVQAARAALARARGEK